MGRGGWDEGDSHIRCMVLGMPPGGFGPARVASAAAACGRTSIDELSLQEEASQNMRDDAGGSASVRRKVCAPGASMSAGSGSVVAHIPPQCEWGKASGPCSADSSQSIFGHEVKREGCRAGLPSLKTVTCYVRVHAGTRAHTLTCDVCRQRPLDRQVPPPVRVQPQLVL